MPTLSPAAKVVLRRRYLQQDETGTVVETPDEMFRRVAANLGGIVASPKMTVDRGRQTPKASCSADSARPSVVELEQWHVGHNL